MKTYDVTFANPGSMYRGKPPQGRLGKLSTYLTHILSCPKEMEVQINGVQIDEIPSQVEETDASFTIQMETREKGDNFTMISIFEFNSLLLELLIRYIRRHQCQKFGLVQLQRLQD